MSFIQSIRGRLIVAILTLNALTVGAFTLYSYNLKKSDLYETIDRQLIVAANAVAQMAPEEFHDIAKTGELDQEEFESYLKRARVFVDNSGVEYIYTVVELNGEYHFAIDTPEEEEMKSGEFDDALYLYEDPSPAVKTAFSTGKEAFDEYTDEWGEHRSVFIPFTTKKGTTFVAGADVSTTEINSLLTANLLSSLAIGAVFFAITTIVSWILVSSAIAPLGKSTPSS